MGKLRVKPGFFLLPPLLLWDPTHAGGVCLLAAAIHEAGHALAARICGGRLAEMELGLSGGSMRFAMPLSYPAELAVLLSGSAANGLCFLLLRGTEGFPGHLAAASAVLGLLNLLPMENLDGGRMLGAVFALLGREIPGQRVLFWVSRGICGIFWLFGLYIYGKTRYNTSMLWLAAALTTELFFPPTEQIPEG